MHAIAKTYGYLPSDLLALTWEEYQFCVAVLLAGLDADEERPRGRAAGSAGWSHLAR